MQNWETIPIYRKHYPNKKHCLVKKTRLKNHDDIKQKSGCVFGQMRAADS